MINRQKGKETLLRALPASPSPSLSLSPPPPSPPSPSSISFLRHLPLPSPFPSLPPPPSPEIEDDHGDHLPLEFLLIVVDRVPICMAESLKSDSFFGLNIVL
ncbi:unnamed protein product [Boreogadus saida]